MSLTEHIKIAGKHVIRAAMSLTRIVPVKQNRVLFTNYFGKSGYGDNLKYIADEMVNQHLDVEMFWAVKRDFKGTLPDNITVVRIGTFSWLKVLVTAKFWIDNEREHLYIYKKPEQFYLQTWHGGLALKKIEMDALDSYPEKASYLAERKHDNKLVNAYVSNSQFCTDMYRDAFRYQGDIWETGYPRNDILVKGDQVKYRQKVGEYFSIPENAYVVMYAPTYRKDKSLTAFDIDFDLLRQTIETQYQRPCYILYRLHPNIADKNGLINYTATDLNASKYADIQELMVASDMLITDYSSVMFEFSYQQKPCLLYASDLEDYMDDRSFYFDYHTLPYPMATNNQQLQENIVNFNLPAYQAKLQTFFNEVGLFEPGDASKRVVDLLNKVAQGKN